MRVSMPSLTHCSIYEGMSPLLVDPLFPGATRPARNELREYMDLKPLLSRSGGQLTSLEWRHVGRLAPDITLFNMCPNITSLATSSLPNVSVCPQFSLTVQSCWH